MAAVRSGDAARYRAAVLARDEDADAADRVFVAIHGLHPDAYQIVPGPPAVETLVVGLGGGRTGDRVSWSFPLGVAGTSSRPTAFWRVGRPTTRRRPRVLVVAPDPGTAEKVTETATTARSVIGQLWADPEIDPALVIVVAPDPGTLASWGAGRGAVGVTGYGPWPVRPTGLPSTVLEPGLPAAGTTVLASVVRHEAVHALAFQSAAARGATRDVVPAWLREGLAEYLSARSLGLDGRLEEQARQRSGPGVGGSARDLPVDAAFVAGAPAVRQAAYDRSWLAVRSAVELVGLPAVTRWYRTWSVSGSRSAPAGVPMPAVLGRYRAALRDWRACPPPTASTAVGGS